MSIITISDTTTGSQKSQRKRALLIQNYEKIKSFISEYFLLIWYGISSQGSIFFQDFSIRAILKTFPLTRHNINIFAFNYSQIWQTEALLMMSCGKLRDQWPHLE